MISSLARWSLDVRSHSTTTHDLSSFELTQWTDLIECGPYVCGANFSGFKAFMPGLVDLGFPIAEISPSGGCIITKPENTAGAVTRFTVTAQLLYELQGELYLNPDVVADLSNVSVSEDPDIPDCVQVTGVKGLPPPATTKAMFAAPAGYQAEAVFYLNGLDIDAKAEMMQGQIKHAFRDNKFSKLSVELYGSQKTNPHSQQEGTAMLRVFAQARRKEDIERDKFLIPIYALRMQSYPGQSLPPKQVSLTIVELMSSLQDTTWALTSGQCNLSHSWRFSLL